MKTYIAGVLLLAIAGRAATQHNQQEAFADGKAYRDDNAAVAGSIRSANAASLPGRVNASEAPLKELYGQSLPQAGEAKIADCAARSADGDAYARQECDAINYLRRNPASRPRASIDADEPALGTARAVRNQPRAFTGAATGLSGSYSACVDKTTRVPLRQETERCQVGRAITEGSCERHLRLRYAWAPFTGQPGAETAYARCPAPTVRGDRLGLPASTAYRTATVSCATRGHGDGTETVTVHVDCQGGATPHGYDASGCSAPPTPARLDPPRAITACTTMPRLATHCYTADGRYTGAADVPVFEEEWDDSDCAAFDRARGTISQAIPGSHESFTRRP